MAMDKSTVTIAAECPLSVQERCRFRLVFFRILGLVCVALGIAGAFLPLLPTTIFLIAAVYCFAKSAPAWRQRILDHPRFGPPVRDFVLYGVLSRRAKSLALFGIAANFTLSWLLVDMTPSTVAMLATVLAAVSAYVATRPDTVDVKDRN